MTEPSTSAVEQAVATRIAKVRAEGERRRQQRAELAAARAAGLGQRNAAKLRRQARTPSPEEPQSSKEKPVAATKPVYAILLCPACRAQRRCRAVGTATVGRQQRDVLQCTDASCELVWCPGREHLTDAPATA